VMVQYTAVVGTGTAQHAVAPPSPGCTRPPTWSRLRS
jgi:hypothetical protein